MDCRAPISRLRFWPFFVCMHCMRGREISKHSICTAIGFMSAVSLRPHQLNLFESVRGHCIIQNYSTCKRYEFFTLYEKCCNHHHRHRHHRRKARVFAFAMAVHGFFEWKQNKKKQQNNSNEENNKQLIKQKNGIGREPNRTEQSAASYKHLKLTCNATCVSNETYA